MEELLPNTTEAATEKHLPAVTVAGDTLKVQVGSVEHPATPEHHIEWIYVETENGGQFKEIVIGQPPKADFALAGDKAIAVYAYCNLHGLWKTVL
jgi:superoxide reductase